MMNEEGKYVLGETWEKTLHSTVTEALPKPLMCQFSHELEVKGVAELKPATETISILQAR